ncbi:MAG: SUMF1/EgtB/PvdO family nonheme iron enzyme [Burkholderiales bacterium]|jgi:formylglycine-generating enzyme required for sulfatase activity
MDKAAAVESPAVGVGRLKRAGSQVGLFSILALFAYSLAIPAVHAEEHKPGDTFRDCDTCPEMVVVPPGSFEMRTAPWGPGHPHNEGYFYPVTFTRPFAVGKFEVTFDEWDACVSDGVCAAADDAKWGRSKRPVINVSFNDASRYVRWLSRKTGQDYRLPTNSEWEYAARAGLGMNRYFGISPEDVCKYGNIYDVTSDKEFDLGGKHEPCDDGQAVTAPVGSYEPNAFGLYDMIGNVFEWTEDCASPTWRGAPGNGKPWLDGDCSLRGFRGASWLVNDPYYLIESSRFKFSGARDTDLGFRVVRELK